VLVAWLGVACRGLAWLGVAWRDLQCCKALVKFLGSREICKTFKNGEGRQAHDARTQHTHTAQWMEDFLSRKTEID